MCIQCIDSEEDNFVGEVAFEEPLMEVFGTTSRERAQKRIGGGSPSGGAVGSEDDASLAEGEERRVLSGNGPGIHQAPVGRHQQGRRAAPEVSIKNRRKGCLLQPHH